MYFDGVVPTGFDRSNFLFRLDHRLNGSNQFMVRYNLYDIGASTRVASAV